MTRTTQGSFRMTSLPIFPTNTATMFSLGQGKSFDGGLARP